MRIRRSLQRRRGAIAIPFIALLDVVQDGSLVHRLFQARSLRLDGQLSAEGAASWVSGLLIGTDVGGAMPLFDAADTRTPVHVVGTPRLNESYALALERNGRKVVRIDGAAAALAGLARVFHEIRRGDP